MDHRLQLHETRVQKGIDLARIAAVTALHPRIVAKIDQGRFEELPPGVYARAYVRAFAEAVGVNAHHVMIELEPLLPSAPDPLPVLRDLAPPTPLESLKSFFASQRTLALGSAFGSLTPDARSTVRRAAAAAVDAAVLLAIGATMVLAVAATCGVTVDVLLREASGELALMFTVPLMLYFVLFEKIAGRTPGQRLCRTPAPAAGRIILRVPVFSPRPRLVAQT